MHKTRLQVFLQAGSFVKNCICISSRIFLNGHQKRTVKLLTLRIYSKLSSNRKSYPHYPHSYPHQQGEKLYDLWAKTSEKLLNIEWILMNIFKNAQKTPPEFLTEKHGRFQYFYVLSRWTECYLWGRLFRWASRWRSCVSFRTRSSMRLLRTAHLW